MPPTYLDETRVPPGICIIPNDIFADCGRTLDVCRKAFNDEQVYPDVVECGPGFCGAKTVVVLPCSGLSGLAAVRDEWKRRIPHSPRA